MMMEVDEMDQEDALVELFNQYCDKESIAIPLLEKVMPPQLAKSFFNKYNSKIEKRKEVSKLSSLCAMKIATNGHIIATLYRIYGPESNLPIPSHLIEEIQKLSLDKYKAKCKLTLLLINNNYTHHKLNVWNMYPDAVSEVGYWEKRIWEKIDVLTSNKMLHIEEDTNYHNYPTFNLIDIALPNMSNFTNLQTLSMARTPFLDRHIVEIARVAPNLTVLGYFEFTEIGLSDVSVQALSCLKKLKEIKFDTFKPFNALDTVTVIDIKMDEFTKKCIGAMPKLEVVGSRVRDDRNREHKIPKFNEPTVLALRHLQVCKELIKECSNSSLANVRFVCYTSLQKVEDANYFASHLDLNSLEEIKLKYSDGEAVTALFPKLGQSLKIIDINCTSGSLDFLMIINVCPCLESLEIGGSGEYTFGSKLQKTPNCLKHLNIMLQNPFDQIRLPPGALARLFQAPGLETVTMSNLKFSASDCYLLISELQTSSKLLCNLKCILILLTDDQDFESLSTLLIAMATFCTKLTDIGFYTRQQSLVMRMCAQKLHHLVNFSINGNDYDEVDIDFDYYDEDIEDEEDDVGMEEN